MSKNNKNAFKFGKLAPLRETTKWSSLASQVFNFVSISKSIFRYNDHVLRASSLTVPLKFTKNKLEYSLDVGIDLETCSNVQVADNLFENNYNLKLFDLDSKKMQKSGQSNRLDNTIENLRKILGSENKILIRSNNSCVKIQKNFFTENNGVLLKIVQRPKNQASSKNVFKSSRKHVQKGLSKKNQMIHSKPSQKSAKKESLSSDIEAKRPVYYLKSRFNESVGKKIDPGQVSKRVPVYKILKPRTKEPREEDIQDMKPRLNKQFSYLTLLEKQTISMDSR